MDFDHATLVWFSKSFGLLYLVGLSLIVLIYACWPSNRAQFDQAAKSIIHDEDKPYNEGNKSFEGKSWR